jgi:hypothetical protein
MHVGMRPFEEINDPHLHLRTINLSRLQYGLSRFDVPIPQGSCQNQYPFPLHNTVPLSRIPFFF